MDDTDSKLQINIQVLCIHMFLFGNVSFRSIPRILKTMFQHWGISKRIMHFTSVINWCLKLGLNRLNNVAPSSGPWTAIIDASIEWGKKKALVILRVPTHIMNSRKKALTLSDAEVVSLTIHETLNGETVERILKRLFQELNPAEQVLSDGGAELIKGVELLRKSTEYKFIHTLDIGHYFANLLKQFYSKQEIFNEFISFASQVGNKLRQTIAAWIVPNKLRKKGRFQSISKLAEWANDIFEYCDQYKKDHDETVQVLLDENFSDKQHLFSFANIFSKDCQAMNEIQKTIKHYGLSQKTYNICMEVLSSLPMSSNLRHETQKYLSEKLHLFKANEIEVGLLSTDILECLFGKFKYIKERSSLKDFNKLSLIIPLLTGNISDDEIISALSENRMQDIYDWEKENIGDTLLKEKRRNFRKLKAGKKVPKPVEPSTAKAA